MYSGVLFFFFFSSRRRHTRSLRDWSSDVCSSDLSPSCRLRRCWSTCTTWSTTCGRWPRRCPDRGCARTSRRTSAPRWPAASSRPAIAAAGLGEDLLLANEVLDARRLGAVVAAGARLTVAVDSEQTVRAAAAGGVAEVVIDGGVGLPRCGCAPEDAGRLADLAPVPGAGGA